MTPVFANPAGFWALLGIPVILLIHALQQRSKLVRTSAWFLIEYSAPDSARGRTFDRVRNSRQLWLQLAAVVVASWALSSPRWVRAESAQTVAIVLDASASMDAFRKEAISAAKAELSAAEGLAAHTTWIVMTTDPQHASLYRGADRAAATAAIDAWAPGIGEHDTTPALRLARGLAGPSGRALFITDSKKKTLVGQRTIGVGQPLENVGFAGSSVSQDSAGTVWRALVQNHAKTPQQRSWHLESASGRTAVQNIDLEPGTLVEISGRFPDGADEMTVALSGDKFDLDDRLPMVRPKPKPILARIEGGDDAADFFRKVATNIDGVTLVGPGANAALKIARLTSGAAAQEQIAGIYLPPMAKTNVTTLDSTPLTPERSALVSDVSWQAWVGASASEFKSAPGDTPLIWQGSAPLIFLRSIPSGGRKLMLAFDWESSNAGRLPAMILLVHRFILEERDKQIAFSAANFDTGERLNVRGIGGAGESWTFETKPLSGAPSPPAMIGANEALTLRAPPRPGFFSIRQGATEIVHGAAQFSDARQGDFKEAETFTQDDANEIKVALENNTRPDPLASFWLLALAGLLLAAWWERRYRAASSPAAPKRAALA